MRANVALRADVCYNKPMNIVALAMLQTSQSVTIQPRVKGRLYRMDTVSPHDENGKHVRSQTSLHGISGIYQITNTITGDFYIGSSVNMGRRWNEHLKELRKGNYGCVILQRAWIKYGEDAFTFAALEITERDKATLLAREQQYIDTLKPEYNAAPIAGSTLGSKRSPESIERIRQIRLGKKHTAESKEKMRQAGLANKLSEEMKAKFLQAHLGKPMPEETKEKIRQSNLGQKRSEEAKAKMRQRVQSEETKEKLRQANSGKKYPMSEENKDKLRQRLSEPAFREKQRQSHLGQQLTAEQRAKQLATMRSPEYQEKQRQAHLDKEFTAEHRANISKAKIGHHHTTPEMIANMNAARAEKRRRAKEEQNRDH